jgi:hypothetical protein
MATNLDDWVKELEAELATLSSNMWATQRRLEEMGFRVDSGNKSPPPITWCSNFGVAAGPLPLVSS